jgi:hypothetical protein
VRCGKHQNEAQAEGREQDALHNDTPLGPSGPTIRKYCRYARFVGAASSLRADLISGKDTMVWNWLILRKQLQCRLWQRELIR